MGRNFRSGDISGCVVLAAAFSLIFAARPAREGQAPRARPSVLLITLDTVRADHLACYGYSQIKTPTLDQLAADGVRFENAYAQVPITLPSHAVILTGTYPMFNGVRDFTSPGLPEDIPTLAEIFRRDGYHTAAFVSSFALSSMWGLNRGFEVYDDNVVSDSEAEDEDQKNPFQLERRGDHTVNRMLAWLAQGEVKPFFLWLHLYDPHSPYRPPKPYRTLYSGHPYDGEIAFDDAQVGRVIARLRRLNLYEDTLILLLSDHGESLGEHGEGEHGFFVYDATLRIPVILKLPGQRLKGRVVRGPVGAVDVAPTLAGACNLPPEESRTFQGRTLLRAAQETAAQEDTAAYAESYYPRNSFGWHTLRALVTSQFKYIEAPRAELYDLRRDPGERSNTLAANLDAAASMRARLIDFERRFQSPKPFATVPPLDAESLEKLKSLGYLSYQRGASPSPAEDERADPKDRVATLNQILHAADLTRQEKYADADQLLHRLEQDEPDLYVLPFQRGENYLAWERPQLALAELGRALARNPTFDQAALGLGRANALLGRNDQAATAFQLALALNPRNFLASLALAKVYGRQNLNEKAEALLAPVVKAHPDLAEAHVVYGVILTKLKKYREALPEIEHGIRLGNHDAVAYNYLGIAEAELGDHRQAVPAYEKAVTLDPRYAAAYMNLALESRLQGQADRAQAYYKKVCELSDELCRAYATQFSTGNTDKPH